MPIIEIEKGPIDTDIHTWADFAELLALVNRDRLCTQASLADRIRDVRETSENQEQAADAAEGDGDNGDPPEGRPSGRRGVSEKRLTDCFQHLSWRSREFGAAYPFTLSGDLRRLQLVANLTGQQKLYVLLLVSANLPFYRQNEFRLTGVFEEIALLVFRGLMPAGAEAHAFGAANVVRYAGSKFEKLSALCIDIRAKMLVDDEGVRRGDSGDGGLDLVGWLPLPDTEDHIPIAFGQCACSRTQWKKKQLEASHDAIDNILHTGARWSTYMFIPHCFRETGGNWAVRTDVQKVVLLDRLRLVHRLGGELPFDAIGATPVIAEILAFTEAMV